MGAWDLIWNASQDGKISDLQEEIETLQTRIQNLEKWVVYLMEKDNVQIQRDERLALRDREPRDSDGTIL
jgi:predicted  nucleic acid-binding Zn-ribbon protein